MGWLCEIFAHLHHLGSLDDTTIHEIWYYATEQIQNGRRIQIFREICAKLKEARFKIFESFVGHDVPALD